ncbi:hypothetical protein [Thermaerobacter subterraneus]|uniref:Uncharacterized protein n=1 Tax=Thermaerobacter subterraneus DSM 13965 TaxID=867903 RepID=K6PQ70_9FIRM|nr:hypothetical protein [Thermaerobacter subterraneus]EKP95072.1 hypothetical protein ThesuDRAFT_00801 [Thermaerobacter subterraneus DSM 13965]
MASRRSLPFRRPVRGPAGDGGPRRPGAAADPSPGEHARSAGEGPPLMVVPPLPAPQATAAMARRQAAVPAALPGPVPVAAGPIPPGPDRPTRDTGQERPGAGRLAGPAGDPAPRGARGSGPQPWAWGAAVGTVLAVAGLYATLAASVRHPAGEPVPHPLLLLGLAAPAAGMAASGLAAAVRGLRRRGRLHSRAPGGNVGALRRNAGARGDDALKDNGDPRQSPPAAGVNPCSQVPYPVSPQTLRHVVPLTRPPEQEPARPRPRPPAQVRGRHHTVAQPEAQGRLRWLRAAARRGLGGLPHLVALGGYLAAAAGWAGWGADVALPALGQALWPARDLAVLAAAVLAALAAGDLAGRQRPTPAGKDAGTEVLKDDARPLVLRWILHGGALALALAALAPWEFAALPADHPARRLPSGLYAAASVTLAAWVLAHAAGSARRPEDAPAAAASYTMLRTGIMLALAGRAEVPAPAQPVILSGLLWLLPARGGRRPARMRAGRGTETSGAGDPGPAAEGRRPRKPLRRPVARHAGAGHGSPPAAPPRRSPAPAGERGSLSPLPAPPGTGDGYPSPRWRVARSVALGMVAAVLFGLAHTGLLWITGAWEAGPGLGNNPPAGGPAISGPVSGPVGTAATGILAPGTAGGPGWPSFLPPGPAGYAFLAALAGLAGFVLGSATAAASRWCLDTARLPVPVAARARSLPGSGLAEAPGPGGMAGASAPGAAPDPGTEANPAGPAADAGHALDAPPARQAAGLEVAQVFLPAVARPLLPPWQPRPPLPAPGPAGAAARPGTPPGTVPGGLSAEGRGEAGQGSTRPAAAPGEVPQGAPGQAGVLGEIPQGASSHAATVGQVIQGVSSQAATLGKATQGSASPAAVPGDGSRAFPGPATTPGEVAHAAPGPAGSPAEAPLPAHPPQERLEKGLGGGGQPPSTTTRGEEDSLPVPQHASGRPPSQLQIPSGHNPPPGIGAPASPGARPSPAAPPAPAAPGACGGPVAAGARAGAAAPDGTLPAPDHGAGGPQQVPAAMPTSMPRPMTPPAAADPDAAHQPPGPGGTARQATSGRSGAIRRIRRRVLRSSGRPSRTPAGCSPAAAQGPPVPGGRPPAPAGLQPEDRGRPPARSDAPGPSLGRVVMPAWAGWRAAAGSSSPAPQPSGPPGSPTPGSPTGPGGRPPLGRPVLPLRRPAARGGSLPNR